MMDVNVKYTQNKYFFLYWVQSNSENIVKSNGLQTKNILQNVVLQNTPTSNTSCNNKKIRCVDVDVVQQYFQVHLY